MANIIKRVWNQNRMVQIEDLKGMTFQAEQAGHTFQISGVDDEGNTVALTGTPAGVLLRPDNTDVALTCSVSGGVVSATLPANCYDVPGRFGLTIFITSGSSKTAIYAAVGTVTRTSSGTAAPGTTQSVVDLINAINAAVNSIPASYSDLLADIAPTYSNSALYSVGQYAWYDGDLKRCIVPITTAESYTAAHWTSAVLGQDVSDLKSALNSILQITYTTSDLTEDGFIKSNGYQIDTSSANLKHSKFIEIVPGTKNILIESAYKTSYSYAVAFYKTAEFTSESFVSGYTSNSNISNTTVQIPPNARYYVISNSILYNVVVKQLCEKVIAEINNRIDSALEEVSNISNDVISIGNTATSNRNKLNDIICYDFTKDDLTEAGYVKSNGYDIDTSIAAYKHSRFIAIVPGTQKITISKANRLSGGWIVAFYKESIFDASSFISGYTSSSTNITTDTDVSVPAGANYVVFSDTTLADFIVKIIAKNILESIAGEVASLELQKKADSPFADIPLAATAKTIMLLGDSITAGQGSTGYVSYNETIDGTTYSIRGNGPNYPGAGSGYQTGTHLMDRNTVKWYEALDGNGWGQLIKAYYEEKFNCTVLNYGMAGINSEYLVDFVEDTVISSSADIVVIMIGTNDRATTTKATFYSNVYNIVTSLIESGKDVVIMASVPSSVSDETQPSKNYHMEDVEHILFRVANDTGCQFISVYELFMDYCDLKGITIDSLLADGLHPNDNGYQVIFNIITKEIGLDRKRPGATW